MEELYKELTHGIRKQSHPVCMLLCGASGSGKSSFLKNTHMKEGFVYLNIDTMWERYDSREEARRSFKQILYRLIRERYSILWDATCRNKTDVLETIRYMKNRKYTIVLGMVYASLDTVIERIRKRTEQPVEESVVRDIFAHMKKNAEAYMKSSEIDEVYLYNNEHTFKLILHKQAKKVRCISPSSDFYFDISKYC
jgi:predicted ABC-type ATPase